MCRDSGLPFFFAFKAFILRLAYLHSFVGCGTALPHTHAIGSDDRHGFLCSISSNVTIPLFWDPSDPSRLASEAC